MPQVKIKTSAVYKLMNQQDQMMRLWPVLAQFDQYRQALKKVLGDIYHLTSPVSQTKVFKTFEVAEDCELLKSLKELENISMKNLLLTEKEQYFVDIGAKLVKVTH